MGQAVDREKEENRVEEKSIKCCRSCVGSEIEMGKRMQAWHGTESGQRAGGRQRFMMNLNDGKWELPA
jgi:hypothetical protein